MWFPLLVSRTCSPPGRWACPVTGEEYRGRSQLKPFALFRFYTLYWAEPPIHCPCAGLANSRKRSHPLNELREKRWHHQLIHSTVDCRLSKTKATPQTPLCWDEVSSPHQLWSVIPCIIPSPSRAHRPWAGFCFTGLLGSHSTLRFSFLFWQYLASHVEEVKSLSMVQKQHFLLIQFCGVRLLG